MTDDLLGLVVLIVLCWTFASAPVPDSISRSFAPRSAVAGPVVASQAGHSLHDGFVSTK